MKKLKATGQEPFKQWEPTAYVPAVVTRETKATSYREMSEPTLLEAMGTDAKKWAEAFCQCTLYQDKGIAETWFSNAIMRGYDEGCEIVARGGHAKN